MQPYRLRRRLALLAERCRKHVSWQEGGGAAGAGSYCRHTATMTWALGLLLRTRHLAVGLLMIFSCIQVSR